MGLTIYYSGKLRDPKLIDSFVKEPVDACICVGWRFEYLKRSNIMPMKGIMITPEGCETIMLTFTEDGHLANPLRFMLWEDPESMDVSIDRDGTWFAKTQYAGSDVHIAIIKLFRYITEKYFSEFRLMDESEYWDHNDEEACHKRFGEFSELSDKPGTALQTLNSGEYDDEADMVEGYSYAGTMEKWIKEKVSVN